MNIFLERICRDALNVELKKSTKEARYCLKWTLKSKRCLMPYHPKLLFKPVEFAKIMQNGFLNSGIVYKTLQLANKGGE